MEIKAAAVAGTLESSDMMITVKPNEQAGIKLDLRSSVEKQFGAHIRKVILETTQELGVKNAEITVVDRGALDCTVKARVSTAIYRASQNEQYNWGGVSK